MKRKSYRSFKRKSTPRKRGYSIKANRSAKNSTGLTYLRGGKVL